MKSEVENIVGKLCLDRGFRRRGKTAFERRFSDRDLLIECYRHLPNEPHGQHYLDVKMNLHSLIFGLDNSRMLKPHQYMIFQRICGDGEVFPKMKVKFFLDDNFKISSKERTDGISLIFLEYVDLLLKTLENSSKLEAYILEEKHPKFNFIGPGLKLIGAANIPSWEKYLKSI